jgi:hypothetical protein
MYALIVLHPEKRVIKSGALTWNAFRLFQISVRIYSSSLRDEEAPPQERKRFG